MTHEPPKWADRFLRWYCNPKYLEEIEGDVYELFERRLMNKSPKVAQIRFVWDVFRFFRWSNIKNSNSKYTTMNQLTLFGNYLKLGMRNMRRNLVSSMINILGLAIAICFAISIFIFNDMQLNMDSFHTKGDRIYQLTNYVDSDGSDELWSDSPIMLGPALKAEHSAIEAFTRVEYRGAVVKKNEDVFDELTTFVDPGFMDMFDFPMLSGDSKALNNKSQVIISKEMAIKYFADEEPVGQDMSFRFSNDIIKRFTVGAVLDDFPYNYSFGFDFMLPMDAFFDLNFEKTNDWSFMTDGTFIMMKEGESVADIVDSFDSYIETQHASNPEWKIESIHPINLYDLSLQGYQIHGAISGGGHPAGRVALTIIALFLLGMACFNFMNIAVVSASRRLKEIALRKVMGSVKKEIVKQFMTENLLQCFFALVAGALLSFFLLVPWFDQMIPELEVKFRTNDPRDLVLFLVGLLAFVGILSGAYPSFYISRFDTITIFKGKEKFGHKTLFSKVLLGFQFFLAAMTIVGCFIMTEQSIYLGQKDWGYDPEGTMSIYVSDDEQYELLKNELVNHPAVFNYTASDQLIGRGISKVSLVWGDRQIGVRRIRATKNYFDTFRMELLEGRALTDQAFDQQNGAVINQKFAKSMGWESPLGQTFMYDSIQRTVVGVVKDFHYYDFFSAIDPVMILGMNDNDIHYLTIQANPQKIVELDEFARRKWLNIAPNDPYDRIFQEDAFDGFYQENKSNITILSLITGIAIVLACLGLYGLLSFNVQGKLKEFSVRKVLGAEPNSIVRIVAKQYIWVLLIAFVIGAPLGTIGMMKLVVSVFPEAEPITPWPFVVAILIILITLIVTVAGQINKAINVNPAELLRSE
ncbi:MAG: ABC transporter permease [Ekhidna sp.]